MATEATVVERLEQCSNGVDKHLGKGSSGIH